MGVEIKKTVEDGPGGGNPEYIVRGPGERVERYLTHVLGPEWFYMSADADDALFDATQDAGD